MASFDIMKATGEGYKFLINQRMLIMRLAALPILIKFICYTTVVSLNLEANILRQGLVMFPAFLIEGYLICALIRIAIYNQEALVQPPGSGAHEYYKQRGRDIQAGAVLYTLIKLVMSLFLGLIVSQNPMEGEAMPQQEGTFEIFFGIVLFFIFMLWAFRLVWLNIPVTLGYSMKDYMRQIKGMSFSFHILSVWIMCVIPFALFIILFSDLISAFTMHTVENPSDVYRFLMLSIQAVIETIMIAVSSVAVGFGIYWVLTGKNLEQGLK